MVHIPQFLEPCSCRKFLRKADVIDYEVFGEEMQYGEITLDPGEMVIAEAGAMMYMTAGIKMETVFGDPQPAEAGLLRQGDASAGKRMLTGESLFMTTFTNSRRHGREVVAFAAPYPGKILPLHLDQLGGEMICQKDSFLCAARGMQIGIAFQKENRRRRSSAAKGSSCSACTGDGIALVHAGGTLMQRNARRRRDAQARHRLPRRARPQRAIRHPVRRRLQEHALRRRRPVPRHAHRPGRVWLQSLPFSRLAGRIIAAAAGTQGAGGKEEGSLLGGLGSMIMGGDS